MESNPWNPEGTSIPQHQPNVSLAERFHERDAAFLQNYPLLCSVPSQQLFIQAMQSGIAGNKAVQLSEEIMTLATAYVQLSGELLQYKNEYDTLLEKNQELSDATTKLEKQKKIASSSSLQLQQQNANLQQQITVLQQQNKSLHQQNQNPDQQVINSRLNVPAPHRSAEHPDPDIFSADDSVSRKELPLFIRKLNMKFIANKDWYPDEQCKMLYLVSRLKGKAYSTISHGINRDGTIKFTSSEAILVLLEQAFADVDECNTARREILTIKQGQKDTSTHISDWLDVAQKTGLSDDALINHLYDSLHPAIVSHIQNRVMLRQPLPKDLTSYLVEVRHIDSVLRSSNPNYTKSKYSTNSHHIFSPPVPNFTTLPASSPTSPPAGEPMDLSASSLNRNITWTAVDATKHRIPRNEAERCAKRAYCYENKLCSWCYDPGHRARICAEARWNQGKTRSADNKTVVEQEKA